MNYMPAWASVFNGGLRVGASMAKWVILAGAILVVIGIALQYAPWLLNWFGRLPGDIRIETGNTKVYIPVTSMIIVSIVLTVIINLLKR